MKPHYLTSMAVWRCLLLALCLVSVSAVPAYAKRVALVVGNAAYQGESVLRNPVNDATDMAQALRGLGVQVFENKAHTNQSRQDMNALIGRFLHAAEGAELAVVFYAGHGIQSAGSSYLLPTDAKISDERSVRTEGISLNDLLADGADKRISRLVVILDACRNNPYTTRTRSTARGLAPPRETHGTLIAYATADGQVADDGTGRNGVYTEQLLRQLSANGNNKSIRDLLEDTQLAVTQARPEQRPKVYGDSALFRDIGWGGKIQLASVGVEPTGQPVKIQTDPEQEAWELAKKLHTVEGYQRYLDRYKQGRYVQVAQDTIDLLKPKTDPMASEQPNCQRLLKMQLAEHKKDSPQFSRWFVWFGGSEEETTALAERVTKLLGHYIAPGNSQQGYGRTNNVTANYEAGCVGYRTDIFGTREGAVCIAQALGDGYFASNTCFTAGFPYNVIPK